MEISGKRVPYKCVNGGTSKGLFAFPRGVVYQCGGGTLTLRGRLLGIQV